MLSSLLAFTAALVASAVAQSSPSVVCVAGQCLQGFTNTTIGAKLSAPGAPVSVLLLPGQYTSTTNPQLLHNLLTSSSASLTPSAGFENASLSTLPLNLALSAGLAVYSQPLYSGQAGFSSLPSAPFGNTSVPLAASSLALSNNVWAAVSVGSNQRIVLWDSVPDVSQLPSSPLSLLDIQSSACSPACAGAGICSAEGVCTCPPGFNGTSCESCGPGFFGPTCQACPKDCTTCDEGISGTGRCLVPVIPNEPSTCNCLNGACGDNGQCTCNAGWTTSDNGTACAKCASGFFLTSAGDCQVCQFGCSECADTSGSCTSCKKGFTRNSSDQSKCDALPPASSDGEACPSNTFGDGINCTACSSSCATCKGPTSNDCTACATGSYMFNGSCVGADSDGVCVGSGGFIADNVRQQCSTCGAKCTQCELPGFSAGTRISQVQCTKCIPGSVLSQGKCVESCPIGTFVSPQDNLTCIACDSSCNTCSGSADFCLTCSSNQLASNGKCVSSCPSNSISSSGSCITCHPDCATCSGPSFTQCSSCPSDRPVLTNGRCLPTCGKTQYFDKTSSSCQSCDSSCSSCSGPGPSNCLACSSSTQVLRAGSCTAANCDGSSNVIPGLGLCLSQLVVAPKPSGTDSSAPIPSITGLADPISNTTTTRRSLEWWQILLMALGCAFIFVVVLMLYRRRARKQRAKRTAQFAAAKRLDNGKNWRWRLIRFGEKIFGHNASRRGGAVHLHTQEQSGAPHDDHDPIYETEAVKLKKLRDAEEARRDTYDVGKFIDAYGDSRKSRSSRVPSTLPSLHGRCDYRHEREVPPVSRTNRLSNHSMYSEVTGMPRHTPEPRQPVKTDTMPSRFSASTSNSYAFSSRDRDQPLVVLDDAPPVPKPPTEAERYVMAVRPGLLASPPTTASPGSYWIQPTNTGSTTKSRNPFRQ
ncbi:insulin-like growth factor binding protein [Crucibulum laeve]|uniref:Insulin-like growth factor binding protein n=1 Tax=Crucibulum laeve TaxID=68775 RepID=A0A5C3LRG4_9AGAR|nr:insulin-like growth factor binding protein [Crucibulum laeve]